MGDFRGLIVNLPEVHRLWNGDISWYIELVCLSATCVCFSTTGYSHVGKPLTLTISEAGSYCNQLLQSCSKNIKQFVWNSKQRWQQQLSNFSWRSLTTLTTSIQNLPTTPDDPDDPWRLLTTPDDPWRTPDDPWRLLTTPNDPWRPLTTPDDPWPTATEDLCPLWRPCLWPLFVCWTYWFVGWMGGKFQQFTPHILLSVLLCEVEGVKSC